ncbi:MAG: S1 RNA-binding domain-containing protein [Muribaculaceae bacterium]|nr:S1 RNA-binding domain-containing protein [Muribaculaceae bacterium]
METPIIYRPDWQYDLWSDIENCYPILSSVKATVTAVNRNYAFLETEDGISCFLSKTDVTSPWKITDLTEHLIERDEIECMVKKYNKEKGRLEVSLDLN